MLERRKSDTLKTVLDAHIIATNLHNEKQDKINATLMNQYKSMQDNQSSYHIQIGSLVSSIKSLDGKMDQNNINVGKLIGGMESVAEQNKEQFGRLVTLETAGVVSLTAATGKNKSNVALLLSDKTVRIGLVVIAILIVYGSFLTFGVDLKGAKDLITLGQLQIPTNT
jgi:hypothetical protein